MDKKDKKKQQDIVVPSKEKLYENISDTIKEIRLNNNLKSGEMADIIGMAKNTFSSYEHKKTRPSIYVLAKIACKFNFSLDYILGIEEFTNVYNIHRLKMYENSDTIPFMNKVHLIKNKVHGSTISFYNNGVIKSDDKDNPNPKHQLYVFDRNHALSDGKEPDESLGKIAFIDTDIDRRNPEEKTLYLIYNNGYNYICTIDTKNYSIKGNNPFTLNYMENPRVQLIGKIVGSCDYEILIQQNIPIKE